MAQPVAVVTGANSGLGLALAVKLAKTYRVFAGMRSLAKQEMLMEAASKAAVAENLKPLELDVNTATRWLKFTHSLLALGFFGLTKYMFLAIHGMDVELLDVLRKSQLRILLWSLAWYQH